MQRHGCGGLGRLLFAASAPHAVGDAVDGDLHGELPGVVRPAGGHRLVAGRLAHRALGPLLKAALGILGQGLLLHPLQLGHEDGHQELPHRVQAQIQVDHPHQGLEGGAEGGRTGAAAALLFSVPQQQEIPQLELTSEPGQRLPADQGGPQVGQLPLLLVRVAVVEELAGHEAQHRVPQEFQALVVLEGKVGLGLVQVAAMDEGLLEQSLVVEVQVEDRLQFFDRTSVHGPPRWGWIGRSGLSGSALAGDGPGRVSSQAVAPGSRCLALGRAHPSQGSQPRLQHRLTDSD